MLSAKRTRFRIQHRGRMKGMCYRGNRICFGQYALQALEPAWITARQIEAGRRAMTRNIRRGGKIWVRMFPDKPVTRKSAETRMGSGKGKGPPAYWVAVVKPGKILYEIRGVAEKMARKAISIAASKMPIRTEFIISKKEYRTEKKGDFGMKKKL
uniref:Large ribosomal subunit protein uL16c n=1 Tax=Passiflora haematostigma TaxID=159429 RepID=A0A7H0TXQ8_9ROSI|nr:ribosomal protein L16 [Passiflora haematostigma]QNR05810.1 ribosomal protein L16 [Passiflora haematostigma]